ncbi:zinc-binding dehydrogenase [Sphaerobacter thermophilus]|uniref:Alcohol dehydrogenase zinc-binding domain protein n=1 Tax=Sphaerobacter thermophilus (strain ATCC 49802 / DSM 20745 / KCCM 41009 / NCIMB 13125 / S 6022) TaxID=479434 RepID=D1CA68_SPHTD|nr:zinc-binding alcohol dehydrogenase [Sphaerobacter thermophilus]ACZ40711.1 Alcohol dehydrogenase zinc-binding domain protein [Sphaerobacter thermophilus DSM 20745]
MEARAVWLTGPRQVEIRTEPLPPVGPDHVLVRARLSAISHGTEMLVYRGEVPTHLPLDLPTLAGSFAYPIKYGYASVGEIEEAGPEVETLRPGDLIFALHPHQDRYIIPARLAVPLPAGLDPAAGVFVANLETAVNVLLDTPLRFGETAVVFGQGVVGLLITMLLRRAGARDIIAVDPVPARRERALAAGASVALAPDDDLPRHVRERTAGRGADVAVEASGAPAALSQALSVLTVQGTVVVASWYGTKPVALDLGSEFHRRRLRIVSSQVGTIDPALSPRWTHERRRDLVCALLEELPLADLITHRVPFTRAAEAYRLIDTRPAEVLQVVLKYGK